MQIQWIVRLGSGYIGGDSYKDGYKYEVGLVLGAHYMCIFVWDVSLFYKTQYKVPTSWIVTIQGEILHAIVGTL